MYIANEARLLDTMGRYDYQEQCQTKFYEAEMMLEYFEPSDSEIYRGRFKIYQIYLEKLREIAWSINVRPKDFLSNVISTEFESFVKSVRETHNKKSYMERLGVYRDEMDKVFDPLTTSIYKTRRQSDFVPANKLKNQGGDSLR
jgi:DNA-directed RNA polymerase subunit N (RpoN/RPB10)